MNNQDFKKSLIVKSFNLSKQVIHLVDKFPNKRSAWVIADQLCRSSMSIGANIVEAQFASSKKDFINFLHHAVKSANETKYWLALAREVDPSLTARLEDLIKQTEELVKILSSSIITLKK